MAVKYGVSLIMYGENGEVEYGGDMKNAFRPDRDIEDHDKHYFSGLPPHSGSSTESPRRICGLSWRRTHEEIVRNRTSIHFMGYYKFWDPQENFYYCTENTGFTPNTERSEGTYSKYASLDDRIDGYHYYLAYIKFGIGRTTSDAAHEIRDGKITREEGIALVKRYDGEFPKKHFEEFLEYCSITEKQFHEVMDSWRSDHLWEHVDGAWRLKHPIWDEEVQIVGAMRKIRLIARLDIKGPNLIKGVHLEGLRVIGSPNVHALRYYQQGADELIYMDCVASLYGRNSLGDIVQSAAQDVFVPMTVGGGIRSVDDATYLLRSGADKVAVNTAAVANPRLISDIARRFGSQCMVLSIEAKQIGADRWEVYTDNGREKTGLDVIAWVKQAVALGCRRDTA